MTISSNVAEWELAELRAPAIAFLCKSNHFGTNRKIATYGKGLLILLKY
jgi:hypothetical protein